jgi:hypothetical protein
MFMLLFLAMLYLGMTNILFLWLDKIDFSQENFGVGVCTGVVFTDFESIYPFAGEGPKKSQGKHELTDRYIEKVERFKQKIINNSRPLQIRLTEFNVSLEKKFGIFFRRSSDGNLLTRLNNGHFVFVADKTDVDDYIRNIKELKGYLHSKDIKFIYVQCPGKISKYGESQLPIYVSDFSNDNADRLIDGIKNFADVLDLREEIFEDGLDHYDMFYRTDHHWKIESALWGASKIAKFLREKYNLLINADILEQSNFAFRRLPKNFLGSTGRRASLALAEPEDFTIVTPNFPTNLRVRLPAYAFDATGRFEDVVFFNKELISTGKAGYSAGSYGIYLGGVSPLEISNINTSENKKILLLMDSFTPPVASFLALVGCDIHAIDLRDFTGSLKSYIEKNQPNIVILAYNPSTYSINNSGRDKMFNFD